MTTSILLDGDNLRIINRTNDWFWKMSPSDWEWLSTHKFGSPIKERKIYCNTSNVESSRQIAPFGDAGWDIIHTPVLTSEGKCATDGYIFLAMMDALHDSSITNIILGTGDHDFLPVIRRVAERKNVIVVTPAKPSRLFSQVADVMSLQNVAERQYGRRVNGVGPFTQVFNAIVGSNK